ncbi:Putative HC-toxin efflux carrier TOXA [Cytospora mali]|uniref:HC-toxin efflux carrier TOXA n=1 Tax=Cytospora mali TaxID=578113 RepID=A0A194UM57_CYTMA|nr:Putative HC-toxin efflux carrier TOXA [Valsa mali var. pyri (nom. inval.)]
MTSIRTLIDKEKSGNISTPAFLDPKNEQSDMEQGSTRAPSTAPDVDCDGTKEGIRSLTDWETTDANPEVPSLGNANPGEYPSGLGLFFIVTALVLSVFLVSLDQTIVATAIPKITDDFHGLDDVSWYSSAFFMTVGGFQSAWGKAYKFFPLKISFLLAIFTFELGSLICGVAPNSTTLIVGRAIAGVGASGIGSGAYTIIAFCASPAKRPMFTGIIGASYGIASVVGPLIGGVLSDKVTWRWCFYINLPIGGVSGLIIFLFFTTPSAAKPASAPLLEKLRQMDFVGILLIMGAIISYILALQYGGQTHPWNSSVVIGLLVGFVAIIFVFAGWEWYQKERAMMPGRLIASRLIIVESLFIFFLSGGYYLVIYYLPIYFQSIDNVSPTMSGVRNLPLILGVTIATIASGSFISMTGIAAPIKVIGTALATIASGLIYTLDIGTPTGKWIGYQLLGGIGWGLGLQIPIITAQATSPPEDLAEVTAIILFFQLIGGSFLVSAAQSSFVNIIVKTIPYSAPGVNPATLLATGATELRDVFTPEQVPGILVAYMRGLKIVFAISLASVGLSLVVSVFSRWKRLNTAAITGGAAA